MSTNLFSANTPWSFWQCQPNPPVEVWQSAIQSALPMLGLETPPESLDSILEQTLGEGRFGGSEHWQLSSSRRLYYMIKPLLPRMMISFLKRFNSQNARKDFPLNWPIEDRYARFLWEVMRQVLLITGQEKIAFTRFWPEGAQYGLVLTHDIEELEGQRFVSQVADLEDALGFRSSFNFVPERYPLDMGLMKALRGRGFEIGVHGLKHDGKEFRSKKTFDQRAKKINQYFESFEAVGFRAPLTHRHPEWMQTLKIEYDLSFFDSDPFEPMPGGSMSIWPYSIGKFIELPYTLVQDSTLALVLGEKTANVWLNKLSFIRQYQGMALVNSHPDYLRQPTLLGQYQDFLSAVKENGGYWNPLPFQAARWWRYRSHQQPSPGLPALAQGTIVLDQDCIRLVD